MSEPVREFPPLHALGPVQALAALQTGKGGLSVGEAEARLARYGRNAIPRAPAPGIARTFLRQFLSPLIYVLLLASVVSMLLGEHTDSLFILAVLSINAVIGTFQEYNAGRAAEALQELFVAKARVIRAGEDFEIEATEVVPGDVLVFDPGVKVPADARLISESPLEVDESLLTGESLPVVKMASAEVDAAAPLGDRTNMVFAGTLVVRGRASVVVGATGLQTELGRLARSIAAAKPARPPLLVRMDRFTRRTALIILVAIGLLGAMSVARGSPVAEVFFLAVALAVSAIPEGLPVALTVALSIGARRMSKRKVVARRLSAVEALGSCTFIASDKTGTLTLNVLTARKLLFPGQEPWPVTGEGSAPDGEVIPPSSVELLAGRQLVDRLSLAAALCNDGFVGRRQGGWVAHGDAVDVALLVLAHKVGITRAEAEAQCPRVGAIPFEAERQFAATLSQCAGRSLVCVKGASERILPMCTRAAALGGEIPVDREALAAQADALAAGGYRVLAIASAEADEAPGELDEARLQGLVFLGFVGMIDPLRPEAKAAVVACQQAGIAVAMVTGDHPATAFAIARELGLLETAEQVVVGRELEQASRRGPQALAELVSTARVFARVEPNQKLMIVRALMAAGHFVAVTGDGANDAPALRAAHIGIAMGQRGTDVARETAGLILADDNFASIVNGVEEGRIAYGNVRKVVFLLMSSAAAEVLLFLLATAFGLPAPLFPVQLLWLNLVTNGIQDVALAFEPGDGAELQRPPRPPREPIFDRLMVERIALSALVMGGVSFAVYWRVLDAGWEISSARNAILLLMVLFENVQAGNSRSETKSLFRMSPLRNKVLMVGTLAAQLVHVAALYTPGLRGVLHLEPVSIGQWAVALALALSLLLAIEAHKAIGAAADKAKRLRGAPPIVA